MDRPPSDTRERILQTAMALIHARGYADTSLATIRQTAGVSSSSLYHFFASKEALLLGIVDAYEQRFRPFILEPAFARTEDPIERLFAVFDVYREMLEEAKFALGCPLGNLAIELGESHPEARVRIARVFEMWRGEVENCLRGGLPQLDDAEFGPLSSFVVTILEGAIVQARAEYSFRSFDASVLQLRRYLALLAAPRSSQRANDNRN